MPGKLFDPSESHKLEDPDRLNWMPPGELLAHLNLQPGMSVADIGAGTGYFAMPMARAVIPGGTVFAVDRQAAMLRQLREKLTAPGAPGNIVLVEGDAASTSLPDGVAGAALLANVWHELHDFVGVLEEMRRILSPHGRLAVLDWRPDVDRPPGPPIEHRVSPSNVVETLRANHWQAQPALPFGRYNYLITATPRRRDPVS